ncbi:Uncharacterized protein APZ42_011629 [Daphnia magna]|uniref:Uncharacterized protein n=1 Tax=Daphnia magna TaxID=35525 RepID=A0A162CZI6_9CRUS|nr:Uncharacterized protein APZ42_011629 [Daphnia magna]
MTERCSIARATIGMVYHDFFFVFVYVFLFFYFLQHHALQVTRDSQKKNSLRPVS